MGFVPFQDIAVASVHFLLLRRFNLLSIKATSRKNQESELALGHRVERKSALGKHFRVLR